MCCCTGQVPWVREAHKAHAPPALGASAAVNAIVIFSILLAPQRTVLLYGVLPLPAALLGLLYIGGDMFGALGVSCRPAVLWYLCSVQQATRYGNRLQSLYSTKCVTAQSLVVLPWSAHCILTGRSEAHVLGLSHAFSSRAVACCRGMAAMWRMQGI